LLDRACSFIYLPSAREIAVTLDLGGREGRNRNEEKEGGGKKGEGGEKR